MGVETMVLLKGAQMVAGIVGTFAQAKAIGKQQKAIAAAASQNAAATADALRTEGKLAAKNKAQEVAQRTAAARTSFLSSGITMEGTPETAISGMFTTGLEDIRQIGTNYENRARNAISQIIYNANIQNMQIGQQRSQAISSGISSAAMSGFSLAEPFLPENMAGQGSGFNPALGPPPVKPV
jgi:hypothetical protein